MDGLRQFFEIMGAAIGSILVALVGVLLRYQHIAQRGEKVELSRIWIEGPTVLVMGLCGYAAHVYFNMPMVVGYIVAAFLGYLGPSAANIVVDLFMKRFGK